MAATDAGDAAVPEAPARTDRPRTDPPPAARPPAVPPPATPPRDTVPSESVPSGPAPAGPAPFDLDPAVPVPCRSHDPDMWFAESPVLLERAKRLCRGCPVRDACLAGALARREPWGVWGGDILVHGEVTPYKRGRGRPPKHQPSATSDPDEGTSHDRAADLRHRRAPGADRLQRVR